MGIPKEDIHLDDAESNAWARNLHPEGIAEHSIKLEYHTLWDWLMPVWDKFRKLSAKELIGYQPHYDAVKYALIKVDGNFYDKNGEGEIVFGVIHSSGDYDILKKDFEHLEWLAPFQQPQEQSEKNISQQGEQC